MSIFEGKLGSKSRAQVTHNPEKKKHVRKTNRPKGVSKKTIRKQKTLGRVVAKSKNNVSS